MVSTSEQLKTTPAATLTLLLIWAWFVMVLSHEIGHLIGGIAAGAKLSSLEIRPWRLPYSLFAPDPNPLLTLWAGPIIGCLLPLLGAVCLQRQPVWLVAWFCVLANAVYLLLGYFTADPELDSTKIIKAGTPSYLLLLFVAMVGPVSYVAFRQRCVSLISDRQLSMTRRCWMASAAGLIALLCASNHRLDLGALKKFATFFTVGLEFLPATLMLLFAPLRERFCNLPKPLACPD